MTSTFLFGPATAETWGVCPAPAPAARAPSSSGRLNKTRFRPISCLPTQPHLPNSHPHRLSSTSLRLHYSTTYSLFHLSTPTTPLNQTPTHHHVLCPHHRRPTRRLPGLRQRRRPPIVHARLALDPQGCRPVHHPRGDRPPRVRVRPEVVQGRRYEGTPLVRVQGRKVQPRFCVGIARRMVDA